MGRTLKINMTSVFCHSDDGKDSVCKMKWWMYIIVEGKKDEKKIDGNGQGW